MAGSLRPLALHLKQQQAAKPLAPGPVVLETPPPPPDPLKDASKAALLASAAAAMARTRKGGVDTLLTRLPIGAANATANLAPRTLIGGGY